MATPLDPERWDDFAKPVPPSPSARRKGIVDREARAEQVTTRLRPRKAGASSAAIPPRYAIGGAAIALGVIVVLALFAGGTDQVAATSADVAEPAAVAAAEPSSDTQATAAAGAVPMEESPGATPLADAPISWAAVLASLDTARQRYFSTGSPEDLARYTKAGSSTAVRDAATQRELRALGAKPTGMTVKILEVSASSINQSVAELAVADEVSAYQIVHIDSGKVIETRSPRPVTQWRVSLERVEDRWVLTDVRRG